MFWVHSKKIVRVWVLLVAVFFAAAVIGGCGKPEGQGQMTPEKVAALKKLQSLSDDDDVVKDQKAKTDKK